MSAVRSIPSVCSTCFHHAVRHASCQYHRAIRIPWRSSLPQERLGGMELFLALFSHCSFVSLPCCRCLPLAQQPCCPSVRLEGDSSSLCQLLNTIPYLTCLTRAQDRSPNHSSHYPRSEAGTPMVAPCSLSVVASWSFTCHLTASFPAPPQDPLVLSH